jgi:hypothetical protein
MILLEFSDMEFMKKNAQSIMAMAKVRATRNCLVSFGVFLYHVVILFCHAFSTNHQRAMQI